MDPESNPPVPAGERPASAPEPPERHLGGVAAVGAIALVWGGALFLAAGTLRWDTGWIYVAFLAGALVAHRTWVAHRNPELVLRRRAIGRGTPRWDVAWGLLFWFWMALTAAVGALDAGRFAWSRMPAWLWPAGAALVGSGLALSAWAMGVNPHFEGTVRIQRELGHRVVQIGPYRRVRHPGYLALALWAAGTPFLLGSWWTFVPAGVTVAWVALRTAIEDRLLLRELGGYGAYAAQVRYRLLPGVW